MKLYYIESEWDVGLNLTGNQGCYSTEETKDKAIKKAADIMEMTVADLLETDLFWITEVEG